MYLVGATIKMVGRNTAQSSIRSVSVSSLIPVAAAVLLWVRFRNQIPEQYIPEFGWMDVLLTSFAAGIAIRQTERSIHSAKWYRLRTELFQLLGLTPAIMGFVLLQIYGMRLSHGFFEAYLRGGGILLHTGFVTAYVMCRSFYVLRMCPNHARLKVSSLLFVSVLSSLSAAFGLLSLWNSRYLSFAGVATFATTLVPMALLWRMRRVGHHVQSE